MVQVRIIIKRSFPFGVFAVNPLLLLDLEIFGAKIHTWLFFADPFETFKSESEKPKWAMNLSASVACITNNYNRRLNIYSVNQNATSYNVKRKRRSKRGSLESSTSTSRSSSILRHALTDPSLLYEISSRDCPCDHHRLQRLRESQRLSQHSDADPDVDSLVINTFEASVAPFREFLTASSSTTGDSGVNTNSNGSQRSSGRLDKPFKRTFSFSSSSADSSAYDNLDNEVITTVILEHHGCEIVADQHSNNRAHRKSQPFQVIQKIETF